MKRSVILLIICALVATTAAARKKKKKYDKTEVVIEQVSGDRGRTIDVTITDPARQLYGEWDIETIHKKTVSTDGRAYVYLDFANHKFYGSNGCNTINGRFELTADRLRFADLLATTLPCGSATTERTVAKALDETRRYKVTSRFGVEYLHLLNGKGAPVMTLRRQNLDFVNGPWVVKQLGDTIITDRNLRVVIDTQLMTLHGNSGCNIINGAMHIDTSKDFALQFEDLQSSDNECDNLPFETRMLIALEQTESCKRVNDDEIALMDGKGHIVMTLLRLKLR